MEDKMASFAAMMERRYGIRAPETAVVPVEKIAETPERQIPKTKPNKAENFFMMDLMILKNSLAFTACKNDRIRKIPADGTLVLHDIKFPPFTEIIDKV